MKIVITVLLCSLFLTGCDIANSGCASTMVAKLVVCGPA